MENRQTVIIPEKKDKIEKIKAKYNNENMKDSTARVIMSLEATNKLLKAASNLVGVIFIIDLIIPDPIIGLDEIALGAITGATKTATKIIDNKINRLANDENLNITNDDVRNLADSIMNIKNSLGGSKSL